MARPKHKPQRTCISCRETGDKRALIRVVRTPEGRVQVDLTGKINGRGAYLCHQADCWEKGLRKQFLDRALKITLSEEDRAGLETYFNKEVGSKE
jgi:predicted RNA-binding protein YlxR (DUF448 family)